MLNRVALAFLTAGVVSMSAATYKVSLHQDAVVNGKQVKAGSYKIEVKDNNTAILSQGKKNTVEVPVKTETAQSKFASTQVQYTDGNNLQEIRVGGTNTRLVFGGDKSTTSNF